MRTWLQINLFIINRCELDKIQWLSINARISSMTEASSSVAALKSNFEK